MDAGAFEAQDGRFRFRLTSKMLLLLSGVLLSGILAQVALQQFGLNVPLVRPVLAVLFLLFVPGAFAYLGFGAPNRSLATTLCYIYGLSLVSIMGIGALVSLLFPLIGIERPFSLSVLIAVSAILAVVMTLRNRASMELTIQADNILSPVPLFLLLLPLASVLGTALYETAGNNLLLLALLAAVGLIPVVVALTSDGERYLALAVWSISVSLLYHGRIFSFFTITQPLPNAVIETGRWVPNFDVGLGSLLANGVLYPIFAIFSGLPMAVEWNLVNPFIVAMLPVALFEAYRRYISVRGAFFSVCIFMFAYSFYVLYPTGGRAATPVIFLGLLALAISDTELSQSMQKILVLLFGAGVAVTHYGTAYLVIFAFITASVAYVVLARLTRMNVPVKLARYLSDGLAKRALLNASDRAVDIERSAVLNPSFIGYYTAFALAWYLYTGLGGKFSPLPRKVLDGIRGVLYRETSGSAVNSFQQQYFAVSITLAKYLYVVFGLLMAFGIAVAVFKLVVQREQTVPIGQIALGIGFFAMFGGSALPSGNAFSVARVMMIIFTFAVPFVAVGLEELPSIAAWLRPSLDTDRLAGGVRVGLALVIAVFFLLNSGFVAETVTKEYAPSNAASGERLLESENPQLRLRATECVQCNIQTHVWIGNNVQQNEDVYADSLMDNQLDYYGGTISDQAERTQNYRMVNSSMSGLGQGDYIGLLAHNLDLQGFSLGYQFNFYETDLAPYTDGDILYSNGNAVVAHKQNETTGNPA